MKESRKIQVLQKMVDRLQMDNQELKNENKQLQEKLEAEKNRCLEKEKQLDKCIEEYKKLTEENKKNFHDYVRIMAEIDWPAYINGDPIFHSTIIDRYEIEGESGVAEEMYHYYDALYLKGLEEQLSASEVINQERLPLFHEALLLYQLGYYYGSVAILTPQIVGITADIEKFLKKNHASYDSETLALMKKRYGF